MHAIEDLPAVAPGSGFAILARVRNPAGGWAKDADLTDIKVRVDDEEAGEHLTAATLAAADTVHKELQNSDSRWTKDRLGFNVEIHADAGWTPQPNKSYLIKVQFNWTDAAPSYKFYRVRTASSAFSTPV